MLISDNLIFINFILILYAYYMMLIETNWISANHELFHIVYAIMFYSPLETHDNNRR